MSISTTTHLNFHGQARAALEFYRSVFGGTLNISTYGDFGMPKDLPGADDVVFGQVTGDSGFQVMAYDVPGRTEPAPAGTTTRENGTTITTEKFFLSVHGETVEEITDLWKKLSAGAAIVEDLGPSAWAPAFGMLTDRFGITWILDAAAGPAASSPRPATP